MVYQMPCPDKAHVFAASSVENNEKARREVQAWASGHGYQRPQVENVFTVFRSGVQAREWVLLEREAKPS